jgi:hypothetical protein
MAILVWIAFFTTSGCTGGTHVDEVGDSSPDGSSRQLSPEVAHALTDAREAQIVSLCLSESLRPIPDLVNAVLYELAAIRSAYGFDALVRTRARSAWTGEIEVEFDPAASHEFSLGSYVAWNDLNAELGAVGVFPLEFGRARLSFVRLMNPCMASRMYEEVPGIAHAAPVFDPTDGPEIFVGLSELYGYTYLFRYAYGNCGSRCSHEEFFYFRFYETGPVLVGRWNPRDGGRPAWWAEAEAEWIECSCFPQSLGGPDRDRRHGRKKSK